MNTTAGAAASGTFTATPGVAAAAAAVSSKALLCYSHPDLPDSTILAK
jgi:hypothetical protein